tara:strand:- start:2213 stop:2668 length:456 start_codon:yes stop_codon:yes gene_type:complete
MRSLRSPSSRALTSVGLPPDLPANSGDHSAKFFLGAPQGVKREKIFTNKRLDGSEYDVRKVRYSMLIEKDGTSHIAWLEIRPSDFCDIIEADGSVTVGRYGDNSMERLLDADLAAAQATGDNEEFAITASATFVNRAGERVEGRDGVCHLN